MNAVEERGLWVTDECEEWEERDSNSFEIDIQTTKEDTAGEARSAMYQHGGAGG